MTAVNVKGDPWPVRLAWEKRIPIGLAVWILIAVLGWTAAGAAVLLGLRWHGLAAHLAGFTAIRGPGVEVVLTDSTRPLRRGEDPSTTLIQDMDLILLNMMLWYGGAGAVAVNGERITADTTITSSGPTVLINGRRMVGPFHVIAVGDLDVLQRVLEVRGGFVERMQRGGFGVRIIPRQELIVPARLRGDPAALPAT